MFNTNYKYNISIIVTYRSTDLFFNVWLLSLQVLLLLEFVKLTDFVCLVFGTPEMLFFFSTKYAK